MAGERLILRSDISWRTTPRAKKNLAVFRKEAGEEVYLNQVRALQEWLCNYFNAPGSCTAQSMGISPLGGDGPAKVLKVRWGLPGRGKSGGLRLAVMAFCLELRVVVAGAWIRKEDPDDAAFDEAFSEPE